MFIRLLRSGSLSSPVSFQNLVEIQKILQGTEGFMLQASKRSAVFGSDTLFCKGIAKPATLIGTWSRSTVQASHEWQLQGSLPVLPSISAAFAQGPALREQGMTRGYAQARPATGHVRGRKPGSQDNAGDRSGTASKQLGPSAGPVSQAKEGEEAGSRREPGMRFQPPAAMLQRGARAIRPAIISMNIIAEPYRGEPAKLPLYSWLTPSGLRERWKRTLGSAKSIYTLSKLRKSYPGWSLENFKRDALATYEEACLALASGDRSRLRQCMTPGEYGNAKKQLESREGAGWARVNWSLVRRPELWELEVVQGRMVAFDPKDDKTAFAQLTVRVRAEHKFAVYGKKGLLVTGNPDAVLPVQDVWIFERSLQSGPLSRWRVAGRLSVPPEPPPKVGIFARMALWLRGAGRSSPPAAVTAASPPTT
eukprot:jgi/Botrbrau1/21833/Bobra.0190s0047.1